MRFPAHKPRRRLPPWLMPTLLMLGVAGLLYLMVTVATGAQEVGPPARESWGRIAELLRCCVWALAVLIALGVVRVVQVWVLGFRSRKIWETTYRTSDRMANQITALRACYEALRACYEELEHVKDNAYGRHAKGHFVKWRDAEQSKAGKKAEDV